MPPRHACLALAKEPTVQQRGCLWLHHVRKVLLKVGAEDTRFIGLQPFLGHGLFPAAAW